MKKNTPQMGLFLWSLLITLSILWGSSFFFVELAIREIPPLSIVSLRVLIAALILLIPASVAGSAHFFNRQLLVSFLIMGLLNNVVPFTLITWGQVHITSGLAAILNATTPLTTLVIAHLYTTDEKINGAKLMGIISGIVGVIIIFEIDLVSRLGQELLAQSSILIAAVSYGAAGVYGRRFGRLGIPPLVAATGQLTASALVLLPIALIVDTPWSITAVSANGWLALLGLGFISTALAYLLYFKILATAGATNVLLVTLLIPVTTTILGTSFLGEVLKSNHFIGMCFISIGLLVVDGRSGRVLVSKVKRIRVRIQNMIEAS